MTLRRGALLALGGLVVTLVAEIGVARRAPHLDGFTRTDLDGVVGEGSEARRMVWLGDSLSVGVGASGPDKTLPHVVSRKLGGTIDLTVLGASGARASDVIVDQLPLLAEMKPDVVFIEIGSNDVIHVTPRPRFRSEMEMILDFVDAVNPAQVVVLGVPAFGSVKLFGQPLRWFAGIQGKFLNDDVRRAAELHGAVYVDIAAHTGAAIAREPDRLLASDLFHLSDDGYELWADAVVQTLR